MLQTGDWNLLAVNL